MKIVIATDNYPPRFDGISRFLQEIIPELAKQHRVHVIAPDFGPSNDAWPITKIPVSRIRVGDFHPARLRFFRIFSIIKKCDVVFLQALGSIGTLALLAAKLTRKKVVLYTHSIEWELVPRALRRNWARRTLPGIMKAIDRMLYNWIHLLIIPSQGVSDTYTWNKIDNKRVIVPLGVDTEKFVPPKNKAAAKHALGIPADTFVVGYHGRLAREKDLRTLLRGYLRFKAKYHGNTQLLIVGDGLREIREILHRPDVTITGFQEDVVQYLQAMDAYVLASLTETSCLSVMEAMSCGLSVVSTPVGHVKDYIMHEKNGLLFPEQDTVLLAKHLLTLEDDAVRRRLGRAARNTMTKRFSWDITRERVSEAFETL